MILDHLIKMLSLAYAMLCEKLKGMERFQNAQIYLQIGISGAWHGEVGGT